MTIQANLLRAVQHLRPIRSAIAGPTSILCGIPRKGRGCVHRSGAPALSALSLAWPGGRRATCTGWRTSSRRRFRRCAFGGPADEGAVSHQLALHRRPSPACRRRKFATRSGRRSIVSTPPGTHLPLGRSARSTFRTRLVSLVDEELDACRRPFACRSCSAVSKGCHGKRRPSDSAGRPVRLRAGAGAAGAASRTGSPRRTCPSVLFLNPSVPRGVPYSCTRAVESRFPLGGDDPGRTANWASTSSWAKGRQSLLLLSLLVVGLTTMFVWSGEADRHPSNRRANPPSSTGPTIPCPSRRCSDLGVGGFRDGMRIMSRRLRDGTFARLRRRARTVGEHRDRPATARRVMACPNAITKSKPSPIATDGKTFATQQELKLAIYNAKTGEEMASLQAAQATSPASRTGLLIRPTGPCSPCSARERDCFVDVAAMRGLFAKSVGVIPPSGAFTPDGKQFAAEGTTTTTKNY